LHRGAGSTIGAIANGVETLEADRWGGLNTISEASIADPAPI
jgi:hypothetical protein